MIDMTRMTDLRAEIGADTLSSILDVFFSEADATLAALPHTPPEERQRLLHFLRSGALNLGLRGVADAAEDQACARPSDADAAIGRALRLTRTALGRGAHAA